VDYSDYQFNKPLDPKVFKRKEEEYDDKFVNKDDAYWVKARPDTYPNQNRVFTKCWISFSRLRNSTEW
jgi:hypothetical protein